MAKKAELEADRIEYHQRLNLAKSHLAAQEYAKCISCALEACGFADGMMQFERKYEDREFKSIESVDLVLELCPLVLDSRSLASLETLLKEQRRIDRNTADDLSGRLREAQLQLLCVYRVLDCLERVADRSMDEMLARLGGQKKPWRKLIKGLEEVGLINLTDDGGNIRVSLITRMGSVVHAKCSSCGVIGRAEKRRFLGEIKCPKCRSSSLFVILEGNSAARQEE